MSRIVLFRPLATAIALAAVTSLGVAEPITKPIAADPELTYPAYSRAATDQKISRSEYADRLHGFWLGESIANWTGIITEFLRTEAPFFTDEDWGKPTMRNNAAYTDTIRFFAIEPGRVWGADDDTDIEYMYQHLLDIHNVSVLTPEQIRDGWLHHIYSDQDAPLSTIRFQRENALWASNQRAYDLMLEKGLLPPATSEPANNPDYDMIDAQLTTEIFGLMAPGRPDIARRMAYMPIRTTASAGAAEISHFYVTMHALAGTADDTQPMFGRLLAMADAARAELSGDGYPAAMYDFIKAHYDANPDKDNWESTRDAIYERYQLKASDGYTYAGPVDAGINFAAGMVSLFYGQGDFLRTIRIGALAGWDSDNPTATWGGLMGFMLGPDAIEKACATIAGYQGLSELYWITRTRRNFPDHTPNEIGEDSFPLMAERAVRIIDRVVIEEMKGGVNVEDDIWYLPVAK